MVLQNRFMIKNPIARVTAAIIVGVAVFGVVFGPTIGAVEPTAEGYGILGLIAGSAGTFLFVSRSDS